MTTPYERTRAVLQTRELLHELAAGNQIGRDILRLRAEALLRHYPLPIDIDISAAAMPTIWANVEAKAGSSLA